MNSLLIMSNQGCANWWRNLQEPVSATATGRQHILSLLTTAKFAFNNYNAITHLLQKCYRISRESTTDGTFLSRYKCNTFSQVTAKINISFKIQNTFTRIYGCPHMTPQALYAGNATAKSHRKKPDFTFSVNKRDKKSALQQKKCQFFYVLQKFF